MTTRTVIERLENMQQIILESLELNEWVFGDERTDCQYVDALRCAIGRLEKEEAEELKR